MTIILPKGPKKTSVEGCSPPQELEVSPHSRLYLLFIVKVESVTSQIHQRNTINFIFKIFANNKTYGFINL